MNSRTRPARSGAARASGRGEYAELAARLTDRDRWIVRMLAEHRVLTTTHLTALAFAHTGARRAQRRLRALADMGVIDHFRPLRPSGSAPAHWVTTPLAFTMLAAEDGHHDPTAPGPGHRGVGRGLALAHNQQLGHQLGINTCLTHLATATPTPTPTPTAATSAVPGGCVGEVSLWWGQARCTHLLGPARPDAFVIWTDTRQPTPTGELAARLAFALEYDTGTETLAHLAAKLAGYHALALASAVRTPVLFWLPTLRREHHARAALADTLTAHEHPGLVPVATAHPHPHLPGQGWHPHSPIWRPVTTGPGHPPHTEPATALSLAQLASRHSNRARAGLIHHDLADHPAHPDRDTTDTGPWARTGESARPGGPFHPSCHWHAPTPTAPQPTPVRHRSETPRRRPTAGDGAERRR